MEIRGRIWLWGSVLEQCHRFLTLRSRTKAEIESGRPLSRHKDWLVGLRKYSEQQPDYKPGSQLQSHHVEYTDLAPQIFPSFGDCHSVLEACETSMVVLFCQIFHSGNRGEGAVAKNTKNFVSEHLNNILKVAFETDADIKQFEDFRDCCLVARDKMLGHADGGVFEVKHGDVVTTMKSFRSALETVDFEYFESIIGPLNNAIWDYGRDVVA